MTVLDRPVAMPVRAGLPVRAVLALARSETRRLLLHPLVIVSLVGWVALVLWSGTPEDAYPVLQYQDEKTQIGLLLIGLAVLLAANSAVLRSRRHGTEAHFGVLVVPPWRRTIAHALSVLPLPLVVAAVVAGQSVREAARPGAVGHASVFESATGPLLVLLFGLFGVLLGRLVRSAFAAPVAVIAIITVEFVFGVTPSGLGWLSPMVPDTGAWPLPSDLVGRPAGWHALYLVGLTLLAAAGAVLASGGRTAVTWATAVGALGLTLAGAVTQSAGASDGLVAARERATRDPAAVQECVRREATTYCAFPEFTPWIGRWRTVTDGVRSLAGAPAATREFTVRQRVYALDGPSEQGPPPGPRGEVTAGTAWGGERELEFAASVARGLVVDDETSQGMYCDARGILIMWMAISGVPDGKAEFATTRSHASGGGAAIQAPVLPVTVRDREYAVVRALLDKPRAEVAGRVKASWTELVRPGTSTARAAALLGVTAPAETAADREGGCA